MARERQNAAEAAFEATFTAQGCRVTKRGWPDFLVFDEDGKLLGCVEVKPQGREKLKPEQDQTMRALSAAGIPCYRWKPDEGLVSISDIPVWRRGRGTQTVRRMT